MGAKVANMSLGGTTSNTAVRDAIASHPDTLYVISAGNDGEDNDEEPHYPCNYNPLAEGKSAVDNVVCVAATDQADQLADFSDWGATSVDLGAPGTETLSTYPAISTLFSESFEANDFATKWEPTGAAGFGRAAPGDGPLGSFGMNDSPGGPPANNSSTSPPSSAASPSRPVRALAPSAGCASATPTLARASSTRCSATTSWRSKTRARRTRRARRWLPSTTVPITGLGGTSVKIRFGYTAGAAPGAGDGIWLDDLELTCNAPLSTPPGYGYLQGTSMAAPHVTGAAGLLFSLDPPATVTEVRNALLAGVDPVPSLTGKTVTGGRLDVARAMDVLAGPVPVPVPPAVVTPTPASPPGNAGATVKRPTCKVPKLVGKTQGQATAALKAAHCTLGKVTKPRTRKGQRPPTLVVKSSSPGVGAQPASGKVDLTLGPKPKPKKRHH